MLTYGQLLKQPHRFAELAGDDVLIAASTGEVLIDRPTRSNKPDTTMVFVHETIALMRADRAEQLDKLARLMSHTSPIVPLRKKITSIWDHVTIGRASTADIVLDDPAVSNVHAHFALNLDDHPVSIQDLGSSNGTFVNRVPMQPHAPLRLVNGDCVRVGQTVFYFVTNSALEDLLAHSSQSAAP
jgi:pSer/pThr/pTyr-binding forkhead associated (FHA) protein